MDSSYLKSDDFKLPKEVESSYQLIKKKSELKVLLFGPKESQDPEVNKVFNKKIQIQKKIIDDLGHKATLGEDDEAISRLQRAGVNLLVAEYIEALNSDYIVCIMASPGSIGEVHDFATKFPHKMMICVDQRHKNGYSGQGIIQIFIGMNGKVDWYLNPVDIDECHLAGRVIEQIKCVCGAKQFLSMPFVE